jgi:hypothetical protein
MTMWGRGLITSLYEAHVIYLPQHDELILFQPAGMAVTTRDGFDFPVESLNRGKLIQEWICEL